MSPGPPPKHPSRRARRGGSKGDFSSLPAGGRKGAAPSWPLLPDVQMTAHLEIARDKIASLSVDLEGAEDGRTKGRLRRQLDRAEMIEATLTLQIEQAVDVERALWAELWTTPQAVMWDESSAFNREVAQYVRWKVRAEQGDLKSGTEARMMSDRLGLNPLALMRLRREVEETQAAEDRGARRRSTAKPAGRGPTDDPRSVLSIVS